MALRKRWSAENRAPGAMLIKGLGGGVPISAVLAQQHCSVFEHGDQGGTYAGNPLMCAVSLAVVQELSQPDFLAQVSRA